MHRIDTSSRSLNENGAGKDGFRDDNAAIGQTGTDVSPDWLNEVQEEIANPIEEAGLTLTKGVVTQLADAIKILGRRTWEGITGAWSRSLPTAAPFPGSVVREQEAGGTLEWVYLRVSDVFSGSALNANISNVSVDVAHAMLVDGFVHVTISCTCDVDATGVSGIVVSLPWDRADNADLISGIASIDIFDVNADVTLGTDTLLSNMRLVINPGSTTGANKKVNASFTYKAL